MSQSRRRRCPQLGGWESEPDQPRPNFLENTVWIVEWAIVISKQEAILLFWKDEHLEGHLGQVGPLFWAQNADI